MKLGNADIGNKLFVAPMAEVTDAPFRKITKEYGAGFVFTQMVSAAGIVRGNFDSLRFLTFSRDEKPVGVQLLGKDPDILARAVTEVRRRKADLIDLNCGCPMENVTSKKMGASLLDYPELLGKLVRKMSEAAEDVPVSVKVRLGRDKNTINLLENIKVIEDNGASLIFIHARTRLGKYDEQPDWDWIKRAKENSKIPVIGNGSIFTPQDVVRMKKYTGCDSVLVARGAIGNPFFFRRYNSLTENGFDPGQPAPAEAAEALIKHISFLSREYSALTALNYMKKQALWYFRFYNGIARFSEEVIKSASREELEDLINIHAGRLNSGFYPPEDPSETEKKFREKVLFWLAEGD